MKRISSKVKAKYVFGGMICISLLVTACGSVLHGSNKPLVEKSKLEQEKGNMETKVTMTEEQKNLLMKISVNEERVEKGEVLEWQKEVLRQYDYALEYLKKKYPSYVFHMVDCEPKNKLNAAYSTFSFTEEGDKGSYYDLYLYIEEGNYSAEDNFYGHIIGPRYEAALMALLKEENIPCNRVEVRLSTVQGEAFNETMKVEEVINGNIKMDQITEFYIDSNSIKEESYQDLVGRIQKLIEKKNIYGGYFVTIYDADNGDQKIFSSDFNHFD